MECSLDSEINWVNIVIKADFFEYLELNILKELSLTSRVVRVKLKPYLYRNLNLSSNIFKFKIKNSVFIEYANRFIYPETYKYTYIDKESCLKRLSAEEVTKDFTFLLKDIKKFVKTLKFEEAKKTEYYLFPIINIFNNLTSLKLYCCVVPLDSFNKLGESLLNLKKLEMVYVYLYKLPTYDMESRQVTFPSDLINLNIRYCTVASSNLLSNPYQFLSSQDPQETYISFNPPIAPFLSLKKLTFFNYGDSYSDLYSFFALNSDLEYLKIKSFSFGLIKHLKSLKCLDFDIIDQLDTKAQTCALNYISKLSIGILYSEYYGSIRNLCLLCPNLIELSFYMGYGEHKKSIDSFLIPLILSMPLLKTLKLILGASRDKNLNFEKLHNIEALMIDAESSTILNINFETSAKLKKIRLISNMGELNTQEFRDKFNRYDNWSFKFTSNTIKGYRKN